MAVPGCWQMYVSDYNMHSTEYDFRKALDLLSFVDKVRRSVVFRVVGITFWTFVISRRKFDGNGKATYDMIRYDRWFALEKTDRQAASLIQHMNQKNTKNVLNGTKKVKNKNQETDSYGRDKRPKTEKLKRKEKR